MRTEYDLVVVGAGHAGVQLATSLTKSRFPGSIALLSDEPEYPYERPPLSKGYLAGTESIADIRFRTPEYWLGSPVDLLLDSPVDTVDVHARCLATGDRRIRYRTLVWATGGRPRRLGVDHPGPAGGVHQVRSLGDVELLRSQLTGARHAVLVGGGYIGLEVAAALRKLGTTVTVLEAQERLLARVTSPVVSEFFHRIHSRSGVRIRCGETVAGISGDAGRVTGITLSSGEFLAADVVVVGIGILPNTEQLAAAGVHTDNGVVVSDECRSSVPGVYAIGDCAAYVNEYVAGGRVRLESVQNATEHAKCVVASLLGKPAPVQAVPWFWSNQYDLQLKTAGVVANYDEVVVRGDPGAAEFSVVYLAQGRMVAIDAVNRPRDFVQGRTLISGRTTVDPALISDVTRPLTEAVRPAN